MDLKDYLESRCLSRKEFADLVGINVASVTNYILGHRRPILEIALKIQEATQGKVSAADLLKPKKRKKNEIS